MGETSDFDLLPSGQPRILAARHVQPYGAAYITDNDQLFLTIQSRTAGIPLLLQFLLQDAYGVITINRQQFTTFGSSAAQTFSFPLGSGLILSLTVTTLALPKRGDCYVTVFKQQGIISQFLITQIICQGYVTGQTALVFPPSESGFAFEGRGLMRSITGTTPAAGAEISETVPVQCIWRLIAFTYVLTTSATAGSRASQLAIDDGANILTEIVNPTAQIPSQTLRYSAAPGQTNQSSFSLVTLPLPGEVYLPTGFRIRTNSLLLLGNDQYSAPQYLVEEWQQL